MTYLPDLTRYVYFPNQDDGNVLNIGWLDRTVPYNEGDVDWDVVRKLLALCRMPVNQCRGWHPCPYCKLYPARITVDGQTLPLRDAEIRVSGENGVVYAPPTLICHYIYVHKYLPPDEFLAAVEKLPRQTHASEARSGCRPS